ncbi:MAG: tetratricopeptide repeat protein [Candidatus Poribacteria bacterium]|nr:tetratricopeptide repeat protein [Candidatus Poribacteria bacterium]
MTIFELAFISFNAIGTTVSIVGGINALKDLNNSTAADLFKESFIDAVKQNAPNFAALTNPAEVGVDRDTLDNVIASLEETDITTLMSTDESGTLSKIAAIFKKCIILPGHQLTEKDLERKLQPVIKKTFAIFLERLPRNQQATNETMLEFARGQSASQDRLIKDTETIKEDTNEIKEMIQATLGVNLDVRSQLTDFSNRQFDLNVSEAVKAAVTAEHKAEIDNAQDLLNKHQPHSALNQLEKLKDRIWENASSITKFRILTSMGATQHVLNKEQEAAMLILKAFQYNTEDEIALSNRAVAHFLLQETEMAEEYAKKTLKKNPTNISAYRTLIDISTEEETLEEVIAKAPEYLQEDPQIAYGISNIAKERGNLAEARKWRETVIANDHENTPDFKAALAAILVEQVLEDTLAVYTKQFGDSQREQLKQAVELLTEARDCVVNTELHTARTDWIINRSTAYYFLGEWQNAIKDLDAALEIEPAHSLLLKNRAILAFEQGEKESAIGFLEKIESGPETSETSILIAIALASSERCDEAIVTLNNFLQTNPSPELQEEVNRWLVHIYINDKRFEEAERISTAMRESSPENILALVEAARLSKATGKQDEALSHLKEAYKYAQNSEELLEIVELADQLYIHELFKEAATLYEKIADTSLNSEWTQSLFKSYYNAGEIGKAFELCQQLRAKYGAIENGSKIEYEIYKEIGDLNQAVAIGTEYLKAFPGDLNMQMDMAHLHYRLGDIEAFKQLLELLEGQFDLKNMSLESCLNLAYLDKIASKPKKALDIMYEARRIHYANPDMHLKYFGLFLEVEKQLDELSDSPQVQIGTAVCLDRSGETNRHIIEKRDDANPMRNELDVNDPLAQQLLDKTVDDEIILRETPFGPDIGKIIEIQSKYVHAFQEICREFPNRFPTDQGLWATKLDDSEETDDSEKFQPLLNLIDKQYEASRQTAEIYKETPMPIGAFAELIGRNVLDTWGFLRSEPDLGIRCCIGNLAERNQARTLFENSQPKLVVDIISLITLYCLEAADTVVRAFGKLGITQSTIDALQRIIFEREAMWSERGNISIEKQGDGYVKHVTNPEEIRKGIEYLKDIIKWIRVNCEVQPVTAALQINQLRKRKFDDAFQSFFIDTLLIASQPDHLLLSDDERLRQYAKTNFSNEIGTDFDIDGVWTQVVLEHCVNRDLLDRTEYNKMIIKLVCSNYYHTQFNAEVLMEAARQSDWKPSAPYNNLVQALSGQRVNLSFALDIAVDFLFKLWTQSIVHSRSIYLTQVLLDGLTFGRRAQGVLAELEDQILNRFELYPLAAREVLSLIRAYALTRTF